MNNIHLINTLESRYDPENDTSPEWPHTNWAENALLQLIISLFDETVGLQHEISKLNERVDALLGMMESK